MLRAPEVVLTGEEAVQLEKILRSGKTTAEIARRLQIVALAAEGLSSKRIAKRIGTTQECVRRWRRRFAESRLDGVLVDAPRSGRPALISVEQRAAIVTKTIEQKPKARTHWSRSSMAKEAGVSASTIGRLWKAAGLKPHHIESFKLSNDPYFEEKLRDIVGLYLAPPQNAVVFAVDEKSGIQALDRSQPGLPFKPARAGTMTHDYKRHGTTTLFAALNVLTGAVVGCCKPRHTHEEFLAFLRKLNRTVPRGQDLHVICDNYAAHKSPPVKKWLEKNKRVHLHFTPTSASWLNLVERYFRELSVTRIRRGVFTSVHDLIDAIDEYIIENNRDPKPFIWTKSADDILAKVLRARAALEAERGRLQEMDTSGAIH